MVLKSSAGEKDAAGLWIKSLKTTALAPVPQKGPDPTPPRVKLPKGSGVLQCFLGTGVCMAGSAEAIKNAGEKGSD